MKLVEFELTIWQDITTTKKMAAEDYDHANLATSSFYLMSLEN